MKGNELAEKLKQRQKTFGTMITSIAWPGIIPILKKGPIDFVVFEMEHNHFDWAELEAHLRTAHMLDVASLVRVTDIFYYQISKALDLGASGILIPRIESFQQLEQVISMMRLPPRGRKGVGGYDFAVDDLIEKLSAYNDEKLLLIQVETPKVLADLDQMLETGEVAGVIVGPYDLSVSLGIPGQFEHPQFMEIVNEVIRICDAHSISCGMYMEGEERIRYWRNKGMNVIWSGSDMGFFAAGYNQLCHIIELLDE
ncbi:HpcH/HpaI aldolase family protein [Paenibacillus eucommiae]|uniref:2-dehydro-3-deoxyglucarate aldolase/4-hydroxy-2-oxoheptanedioate aldolase n=1 Tax=Paenibacillus eucommiae TaxID=1355755 RepID=A0ABS4IUZ5_9BACL|nr:aldolase/citrate lyase family protein [Paenibacillus eucommiae]MBP1991399.1 2-dehydro-3-deoxyglucarate aldolase/4-hydroxy-2-oxoheptanedioate aldolase [Paenibacillus eucommiae]